MSDYMCHIIYMTLKLLKNEFWRESVKIMPTFTQPYNGRHNVPLLNL